MNTYLAPHGLLLPRRWFGLAHSLFSFAENVAYISYGAIPWAWGAAGQALAAVPVGVLTAVGLVPPSAWADPAGIAGERGCSGLGIWDRPKSVRSDSDGLLWAVTGCSGQSIACMQPASQHPSTIPML